LAALAESNWPSDRSTRKRLASYAAARFKGRNQYYKKASCHALRAAALQKVLLYASLCR